MIEPARHLEKAAEALRVGRYLLAGGFYDGAGREAYMAAFHAALAIIVDRTGKEPKTHKGTHTEFARLSTLVPGLHQSHVAFLSRNFMLKMVADYDSGPPMGGEDAQAVLAEADWMMRAISAMLGLTIPDQAR